MNRYRIPGSVISKEGHWIHLNNKEGKKLNFLKLMS